MEKMKLRLGAYRAKYQKNQIINVIKYSKTNVWFSADGKRFVYPRAKFELDFVEYEE